MIIIQDIKRKILDIIKGNKLGVSYDEILERYDKKYPAKPIGEAKIYHVKVKDTNGEFKTDDSGKPILYERTYRNGGRPYIKRLLDNGLIERNKDGNGYKAIISDSDNEKVDNAILKEMNNCVKEFNKLMSYNRGKLEFPEDLNGNIIKRGVELSKTI